MWQFEASHFFLERLQVLAQHKLIFKHFDANTAVDKRCGNAVLDAELGLQAILGVKVIQRMCCAGQESHRHAAHLAGIETGFGLEFEQAGDRAMDGIATGPFLDIDSRIEQFPNLPQIVCQTGIDIIGRAAVQGQESLGTVEDVFVRGHPCACELGRDDGAARSMAGVERLRHAAEITGQSACLAGRKPEGVAHLLLIELEQARCDGGAPKDAGSHRRVPAIQIMLGSQPLRHPGCHLQAHRIGLHRLDTAGADFLSDCDCGRHHRRAGVPPERKGRVVEIEDVDLYRVDERRIFGRALGAAGPIGAFGRNGFCNAAVRNVAGGVRDAANSDTEGVNKCVPRLLDQTLGKVQGP